MLLGGQRGMMSRNSLNICLFGRIYRSPYFLQFKSELGNKEVMIWATVSSWSCFCWLYRSNGCWQFDLQRIFDCKEYNQSDFSIDPLAMSMCRVFSCVVGRGCLPWPMHSLGETLLAFSLLYFILQGQIFLLLQVFLDLLLFIPVPYNENVGRCPICYWRTMEK